MTDICFYFQVHQPHRLRNYSYFDVTHNHYYEDDKANREIFLKVADKCYLPTNALLLDLIKRHNGIFKISYSLSGTFVDQCRRYKPEVLDSFRKLVDTGCVELIDETYYHSLSFLFSKEEFKAQVLLHREMIEKEFGYRPTTFRNTELIYNNELAHVVESLGYKAILAEGADKILGWRSANYVYRPQGCNNLKLLLRNYRLTDDVGFRFSQASWDQYPLYAEKYASWLHSVKQDAEIINLFMDFETFGEHQWHQTGIFEFLNHLPGYILKHPEYSFATPSEVCNKYNAVGELDVPYYVSWADEDRDLTAWYGNDLQKDSLEGIYSLEKEVKATEDPHLLFVWRMLQTSDHFYYMCTKYSADGDVHKYFNPYHNPYDAYINYQNILSDFALEVTKKEKELGKKDLFIQKEQVSTAQNVIVEKTKCMLWKKIKDFFAHK